MSSPEYRRQGNLVGQVVLTLRVYCVLSAKGKADVRTASTLRNDLKGLAVVQTLINEGGISLIFDSLWALREVVCTYDVCPPLSPISSGLHG